MIEETRRPAGAEPSGELELLLLRLRHKEGRLVAIEGNHDAQPARKHMSWMEYLCDQELLILLNVDKAENGLLTLVPFDDGKRRGSWVEIAGARIYGMKYYGATTGRILEEIHEQIEPAAYTILTLHAGMEGQVPHLHGGLTFGQVEPLHDRVDYPALGHLHKRLAEGWHFNPGPPATNSMEQKESEQ